MVGLRIVWRICALLSCVRFAFVLVVAHSLEIFGIIVCCCVACLLLCLFFLHVVRADSHLSGSFGCACAGHWHVIHVRFRICVCFKKCLTFVAQLIHGNGSVNPCPHFATWALCHLWLDS